MVSERIIIKSIENAIVKCSQRYRLNKNVVNALDKFHKETCSGKKIRKTEKGIALTEDGEIVYTNNGGKSSVKWDMGKIEELYHQYGELHINHNHPNHGSGPVANSFSYQDMEFMFYEGARQQYGVREDGTEGILGGDIYFFKSISTESPNGSRMTLVRGDNFKDDDKSEALSLASDLESYTLNYRDDFLQACFKISAEHPYDTVIEKNPNDDIQTVNAKFYQYVDYVHNEALKEIGTYEKNQRFKDIQKGFSNINCKLTYTFPQDYNIGMLSAQF